MPALVSSTDSKSFSFSTPLHLLVVGAGLCGLAAAISTALEGCRVTVFEAAPRLHETGAGVQITPNGSRLLRKWGVFEELAVNAAVPSTLAIHRFDGKILAQSSNHQELIERSYGSPHWCLYRVDLQKVMGKRALELGVSLRLGARVKNLDFDNATVVLLDGEKIKGDVVLAADGLWSSTRSLYMGKPMPPKPTGDLAYRILLKADDIPDQELRAMITTPALNIWIGPNMHAVGYSICAGRTYNMVLLVPDDLPQHIVRQTANVEEMRILFEGWDPILTRLLTYVDSVEKWRLMHHPPLDTWKNPSGTFVMAGDSCHPMLPYLAQGANSSLEDGAVLGALLSKVHSKDQLPNAMAMYERLRKERGEWIVRETLIHREGFHLPDGPEQIERDRLLSRSFELVDPSSPPQKRWTHPKAQPQLFGYDAYAEVEKAFAAAQF